MTAATFQRNLLLRLGAAAAKISPNADPLFFTQCADKGEFNHRIARRAIAYCTKHQLTELEDGFTAAMNKLSHREPHEVKLELDDERLGSTDVLLIIKALKDLREKNIAGAADDAEHEAREMYFLTEDLLRRIIEA